MAHFPDETARRRITPVKAAAELLGVSVPHLRRLIQKGAVPTPIRIGERKLGWRLGDLLDFIDSKGR